MKLFSANLSPWASRCRIAIYAKNLDIEIAEPPGGLGTPEYKLVNPTGKVPALEVDGKILPESAVINEYLEERSRRPRCSPGTGSSARARDSSSATTTPTPPLR